MSHLSYYSYSDPKLTVPWFHLEDNHVGESFSIGYNFLLNTNQISFTY